MGNGSRSSKVASRGVLTGQRLHEPGQVGPVQVENGRATSSVTRPPPPAWIRSPTAKRTVVASLDERDGRIGEQGTEQPGHHRRIEREQVGVDEDDDVATGCGQGSPQRLALAWHRRQAREQVVAMDDVRAGSGWRRRAVASVDPESTTTTSSTSGIATSTRSRRDRSNDRSQRWTASLRAGSTTLTVVSAFAASNRSTGQCQPDSSAARTSVRCRVHCSPSVASPAADVTGLSA